MFFPDAFCESSCSTRRAHYLRFCFLLYPRYPQISLPTLSSNFLYQRYYHVSPPPAIYSNFLLFQRYPQFSPLPTISSNFFLFQRFPQICFTSNYILKFSLPTISSNFSSIHDILKFLLYPRYPQFSLPTISMVLKGKGKAKKYLDGPDRLR